MELLIFEELSENTSAALFVPGPQKRKGSGLAGAFRNNSERDLVERSRDLGEGRRQLGAEALHDGDNGNRNARGDQAIFDGGRTGLILHKTRNEGLHLLTP